MSKVHIVLSASVAVAAIQLLGSHGLLDDETQVTLGGANPVNVPLVQHQQPAPQFQQPAPQAPVQQAPDAGFTPPMPPGFAPQQPPMQQQQYAPPMPQAPVQQAAPTGAPSNDDVIKAVQAYSKKHGAAATKNVLQQAAGVTAIKDIQPQYYANVIAAVAV